MKEIDLLYENIYQLLIKPYLLDLSSQSEKNRIKLHTQNKRCC